MSVVQLAQFGSVYLPTAVAGSTASAKLFTGASDPAAVTGVVLAINDMWETAGTPPGGFGFGGFGLTPFGS